MSANRTQVGNYLAENLATDRAGAINRAAAWLVRSGRVRQLDYLVRDTAMAAQELGVLYAKVTSAVALTAEAKAKIEKYLVEATKARDLEIEYHIDPARLGGIYLELPSSELDATLQTRLNNFAKGLTS